MNLIVHQIYIGRLNGFNPMEIFESTGRKLFITPRMAEAIPREKGKEVIAYSFGVTIHFFHPGRFLNDEELEKEYEQQGLIPVNPCSLATFNQQYPGFADTHPHGTHWKNGDGWHYIIFRRWSDGRGVSVEQRSSVWGDDMWFAGIPRTL